MNTPNDLLVGLAVMVLLSLALAAHARRKAFTLPTFFWGDSELKVSHVVHLLLSTSFSMNGILYQTWLGYTIGVAAVLIQVIWCISYLLMASRGEKIAALARRATLHGNIGEVFGRCAEYAAAAASIIGFTLLVGWELIVGASLFAPENIKLRWVVLLSLGAIGAIYTMLGGLRGNLYANIAQNLVSGAAFVTVVCYLIYSGPGADPKSVAGPWDAGSLARTVTVLGVGGLVTNAVFSIFWQFVDMSAWQSLAATEMKTKGNAPKHALLWSALFVFIFPGVVGTFAGMYMRTIPGLDPSNIIPRLIQILSGHPFLLVFVAAGFVGALLSTIDGYLLAAGQAATWDLTHREKVRKALTSRQHELQATQEESGSEAVPEKHSAGSENTNDLETITEMEDEILQHTRYWVLGIAMVGGGFILWVTSEFGINIFDLVYLTTVALMALVPVVLTVVFGAGGKKKFGFLSIVSGLSIGITIAFVAIYKQNATWLAWSPFIALAFAFVTWLPGLRRS